MTADIGHIGLLRGEFKIGAKYVPKSTINDSFHLADGTLPYRVLSFRRRREWRTYDEIVESGVPEVISESGWTMIGMPLLLAILDIVVLIWSLVEFTYHGVGFGVVAGLALVWLIFVTPLWQYSRFLHWWAYVHVVRKAQLTWYRGWLRPNSGDWSADSLFEVRNRYRGDKHYREYEGKKLKFTRWLSSSPPTLLPIVGHCSFSGALPLSEKSIWWTQLARSSVSWSTFRTRGP